MPSPLSFAGNLKKVGEPSALLEALAVHASVGIQVYNAEGFSVFTNEQHSRIFGAPPPPDYNVLRDENVRAAGTLHLIHEAFAGRVTTLPLIWYDPRLLRDLAPESVEHVVTIGRKAAVETLMVPVFDSSQRVSHVIFIFKDVTAELYMKEREQLALKERDDAKLQIQRVLDRTKAVIYIKDKAGRFLFVNGQFCRIFGKTQEEIIGRSNHELFPKELADKFWQNDLKVLETGSDVESEEIALHSDGKEHLYWSQKFPLEDSEGKVYGVCGISTDITEQRRLDRELSTAKRMEAVGLLAGGIAHDFNNVLSVIQIAADLVLLNDGMPKSELRTTMESVKATSQKAALLTRQLLAFGRRQGVQPRTIDVAQVVLAMKPMLDHALGEDIDFTVEVDPALWPVRADPMQIEQVLTNLAFNSRDAMPKGGKLRLAARNETLDGGDFVALEISDNGVGIPAEVVDRIFEPFFTTKPAGKGSGLGLSSVYGIVQNLGGKISVSSVEGQGTSFNVLLPKAVAEPAVREPRPLKAVASQPCEGTILLVEDQNTLRDFTAKLLHEKGYTVYVARDAGAALALWKTIAPQVNLVMSDIVMPDMSGPEMLQAMRKFHPREDLKTLLVSGYSEEKLSDYELDPACHLLWKPYSAEELLSKIQKALGS